MVSVALVLPTLSHIHALKSIRSLFGKSKHVWPFPRRKRFRCSSLSFEKWLLFCPDKITNSQSLSRIYKCVLVRDAVFFVVDFFTGDRASD